MKKNRANAELWRVQEEYEKKRLADLKEQLEALRGVSERKYISTHPSPDMIGYLGFHEVEMKVRRAYWLLRDAFLELEDLTEDEISLSEKKRLTQISFWFNIQTWKQTMVVCRVKEK